MVDGSWTVSLSDHHLMMFNFFVFGNEFVFKVINVNGINQTKNKKFKACFIHVEGCFDCVVCSVPRDGSAWEQSH